MDIGYSAPLSVPLPLHLSVVALLGLAHNSYYVKYGTFCQYTILHRINHCLIISLPLPFSSRTD